MVEVGQGALSRVVCEGLFEPAALRREFAAAAHLRAVAVEHDNTPAAPLVSIVAFGGIPCPASEVAEVAGGVWRKVLMVAYRGLGAALLRAPGGVVAVLELRSGAVGVGVVPEGEAVPGSLGNPFSLAFLAVVVERGV